MEFKFIDLTKYYFKKILSNIIVFFIMFVLGLIYIFNIYKTEYVANTTFMIGACFHKCEQEAHLNVDFNKKILFDYMELIKSVPVLKKANKKANLNYSIKELKKMVNASYIEDTEYIKITVVSSNKKNSAAIAYNVFESLGSEIERIFDVNNIHMVESDLIGYEKISKKKLIAHDFIVAFTITIIKTVVQFLFFHQNKNTNLIRKIIKKKSKKRKKLKKILKRQKRRKIKKFKR